MIFWRCGPRRGEQPRMSIFTVCQVARFGDICGPASPIDHFSGMPTPMLSSDFSIPPARAELRRFSGDALPGRPRYARLCFGLSARLSEPPNTPETDQKGALRPASVVLRATVGPKAHPSSVSILARVSCSPSLCEGTTERVNFLHDSS